MSAQWRPGRRSTIALVLASAGVLCAGLPDVVTEKSKVPLDMAGIVQRMLDLSEQDAAAGRRCPADLANEEDKALCSALQRFGKAALPAIRDMIKKGNSSLQYRIVNVLSGIPGDDASRILYDLAWTFSDPYDRDRAFWSLAARTVDFEVPEQHLETFLDDIRQGSIFGAGSTSCLLAKFTKLPVERALPVIVERFVREVQCPSDLPQVPGTDMSSRAFVLHRFLDAFHNFGKRCVPFLRPVHSGATDSELRHWLAVALGSAGEPDVADELKALIESSADWYLRCEAVTAYAYSARRAALPFLRTLLDDAVVSLDEHSPIPGHKHLYLMRGAAEDVIKVIEAGQLDSRTPDAPTNSTDNE